MARRRAPTSAARAGSTSPGGLVQGQGEAQPRSQAQRQQVGEQHHVGLGRRRGQAPPAEDPGEAPAGRRQDRRHAQEGSQHDQSGEATRHDGRAEARHPTRQGGGPEAGEGRGSHRPAPRTISQTTATPAASRARPPPSTRAPAGAESRGPDPPRGRQQRQQGERHPAHHPGRGAGLGGQRPPLPREAAHLGGPGRQGVEQSGHPPPGGRGEAEGGGGQAPVDRKGGLQRLPHFLGGEAGPGQAAGPGQVEGRGPGGGRRHRGPQRGPGVQFGGQALQEPGLVAGTGGRLPPAPPHHRRPHHRGGQQPERLPHRQHRHPERRKRSPGGQGQGEDHRAQHRYTSTRPPGDTSATASTRRCSPRRARCTTRSTAASN